jgi:hypothetical protein
MLTNARNNLANIDAWSKGANWLPEGGLTPNWPPQEIVQRNAQDPSSWTNRLGRAFSNTITAGHDLPATVANIATGITGHATGLYDPASARLAMWGPKLAAQGGYAPATGGLSDSLIEGGLSALMGGGVNAIGGAIGQSLAKAAPGTIQAIKAILTGGGKAATTNVAIPVAASEVGGSAGSMIGEAMGDQELGASIGALAGGKVGAVPGMLPSWIHSKYAGQGKDNAAELRAIAEREGVPLSAGLLGNADIQAKEKGYTGQRWASDYTAGKQTDTREGIGQAWDNMAAARGSIDPVPTTGTIGGKITDLVNQASGELQGRVSAQHQAIADTVGSDTIVPVGPTISAARDMWHDADVPGRNSIDYRIRSLLQPLTIDTRAPRETLPDGTLAPREKFRTDEGRIGAPWSLFKQFTSDLGRSLDQGGNQYTPLPQLYPTAAATARTGAIGAGVSPREYDAAQRDYRIAMAKPDTPANYPNVPTLDKIGSGDSTSAYNYLHGGTQNANRPEMLNSLALMQSGGMGPRRPGGPVDEIFGDYLRKLGNETIGTGQAQGANKLATAVEGMNPDSRFQIGGPQAQSMTDIASLARAINIPTSQAGQTRSFGATANSATRPFLAGEIGNLLGKAAGYVMQTPGLGAVGRGIGYATSIPAGAIGARVLQSPTALNAMAGGQRPLYSAANLAAVGQAINSAIQNNRANNYPIGQ